LSDVLGFHEIDEAQFTIVGGKGARLAELSRIDAIAVPDGFCVTTAAFDRVVAAAPQIREHLARLSRLGPDDWPPIRALSAQIRGAVEALALPDDLSAAIHGSVTRLGASGAYAVRSSATAEDLPSASFAGQHDSYLNVVGGPAILAHVRRCWASLFTERAVAYRLRNGFDHRRVAMAVVVQQMVAAQAAGTLFTADPVSSNRKVASVEAVFGLGEALVSGLANPDVYTVRDGAIISKTIAAEQAALTDAQAVRLAQAGRLIEQHFHGPQDIEWCLVDDSFHIVQSRPITTLFPIPAADDDGNHVYLSVGHQQMMTDPMKPLGLSFWQMTTPAPMAEAGGRLFVDVTQRLSAPTSRADLLEIVGRSDPLSGDALQTIVERDGFVRPVPGEDPPRPVLGGETAPIETDPAIVDGLIARSEASIATVQREIATLSGVALLDFIRTDLAELKRLLFDPLSHQVFTSAMQASWWLNERLEAWLGETNAADPLTQSVPHNVTSEMGLALLDLADVIRPHADVVAFLHDVADHRIADDVFLDELAALTGGQPARVAIEAWLAKYGMRCVGEIDITRPRWSEHPAALVPVILGHIKNFETGAGEQRFEQGRQEAGQKEQVLLERLRALPDGARRADETKQMIDRVRTFIGYREYPKYAMVSRYFVYKLALLAEAKRLEQADVLRDHDDICYLTFPELHDVVRTQHVDDQLVEQRKAEFRSYLALTPPRVLTSDGETINGEYRRDDLPAGALIGLPVSAGTVEGPARVILDIAKAEVEAGDILVTTYTDPGWTALFPTIGGLVTEVGGQMTHGAVIAREYGLPAVVGVQNATRLIKDGQLIRVHGADGYVEILG
jgi:pyruvate,water dikinase